MMTADKTLLEDLRNRARLPEGIVIDISTNSLERYGHGLQRHIALANAATKQAIAVTLEAAGELLAKAGEVLAVAIDVHQKAFGNRPDGGNYNLTAFALEHAVDSYRKITLARYQALVAEANA